MEKVIDIKNVWKEYKLQANNNSLKDVFKKWGKRIGRSYFPKTTSKAVLKNISLQVHQGERLGIIGPNGAGKSTLLKILSRITFANKGSVWVNGRIASLLEIGTGFHQELSGTENIFLFGALLGMDRKTVKHKLDDIIKFSGIAPYINTPIKFYSSGMQVRLAFSIYAFSDPKILLIDEALGVGDINFQQKCILKMQERANSGTTILLVSHDLGLIEHFCNRCVYLDKGEIQSIGTPKKAISDYLKDQELEPKEKGFILVDSSPLQFGEVWIENQLSEFTPKDDLIISSEIRVNKVVDDFFYFIKFICAGKPAYSVAKRLQKISTGSYIFKVSIPLKSLARDTYSFRMELYHQDSNQLFDVCENPFSINLVTSLNHVDAPLIDAHLEIIARPHGE